MGQKLINEIGNKYGLLTPIELTKDKNNRTAWLCKCDCGNTKIVRGSDLRQGHITSCGYGCPLRKQRSGVFLDETGHHYGRLTVLYENGRDIRGKVIWHCKCECGNECDVRGNDLRGNKQLSCGCYNRQIASDRMFKDETGNRYGKLTVISLITRHPRAVWKCQCDCGSIVEVKGIDLRIGDVRSCGCTRSFKEEEIARLLTKYHINFKREYTFSDLRGKQKPLRFDFAIFDNNQLKGLIEYNGIQHYDITKGWNNDFEQQQLYDTLKKQYTQKNNIPLLILNHTNINLEQDVFLFLEEII